MPPTRRSYSPKRVRGLIERYMEMRESKGTYGWQLETLCELVDLQRGMSRLTTEEREVLTLCGLLGITVRVVGELLSLDYTVVHRRYARATEILTIYMNGEA